MDDLEERLAMLKGKKVVEAGGAKSELEAAFLD